MMTPSFDADTVSLGAATTLIEASAGTGKTHSITELILRLLLERDVEIGEIVAVTFTEAATKELRDRVRRRIADALEDLRRGHSENRFLQRALAAGNVEREVFQLNRALVSFDEAQIFTIHGFCQRCLGDHAFESSTPFDTELSGSSLPLFAELARDFWRTCFWQDHRLLAALASSRHKTPEQWTDLLEKAVRHPGLIILPPPEGLPSAEWITRTEQAFAAVREEWTRQHTQIRDLLLTARGLSRDQKKFRRDRLEWILEDLSRCCEHFETSAPVAIQALREVSTEAIVAGTNKTGTAPEHPFFDLCSAFCAAGSSLFHQLDREFLDFARAELPKRKARSNTLTFDDLIIDLRDALQAPGGVRLAKSIGDRYQAALIDEFQDTDPAQYEIFRTLFATGRHCLFLIGDPKQAIYGFRGADIFTYHKAARATEERTYTLTTNWRSEPGLLTALNTLFRCTPQPFVFPWIDYHEVAAPAKPQVIPLIESATGTTSLRFRLVGDWQSDAARSADTPTELVVAQLKADLAALQDSGARLGERRLRYGDFAVLVRTGAEAATIQEALARAGIRSVLRTETNVFATAEAREFRRFLQGVLEPRRDGVLKAALITPFFGLNAHELYELEVDDTKKQQWLGRFLSLQAQWVNGCFIAMFRQLLVEHSVRARLINLPGGERRLTNYLQLAELLHEAETSRQLSPDAVCALLSEQGSGSWTAEERFQLRLESDQDAVQIVTVHKAKGLEYPIVFCPFAWKASEKKKSEELLFHDRANEDRPTLDLREKSAAQMPAREWRSEETRSEEQRLIYVALTRAMNRCYVYVPNVSKILESPLAQLLGADARHPFAGKLHSFITESRGTADVEIIEAPIVKNGARRSDVLPALAARKFTGRIRSVALTASFSGLNTDVELERPIATVAAGEGGPSEVTRGPQEPTIFTFPRGAAAGDFFHQVIEETDFQSLAGLEPMVAERLRLHGIGEARYAGVVCTMLQHLGALELEPGLRLDAISPAEMLKELEFTHPLKATTPAALHDIFAHSPEIDPAVSERVGKLRFNPVEGFMRGFIDGLFRWNDRFYLLDWKSNWLGARGGDYDAANIRAAMLKHNYYLQYHLYTLAADLFLRSRLSGYQYERHFGGVFYLFLRGIERERPDQGVFRARPTTSTLERLHRLLP